MFVGLLVIVFPVVVCATIAYCLNRREKEETVRRRDILEYKLARMRLDAEINMGVAVKNLQEKKLETYIKTLEIVKAISIHGG